jgi:hypothetical protein
LGERGLYSAIEEAAEETLLDATADNRLKE